MRTISVTNNGIVEVCTRNEGREHYDCFNPGYDVSNLDDELAEICASVHTPEVIAEYQRMKADERPR